MWQFDAGPVPGITGLADLDVFCCDLGTLAAARSGGAASVTASNPFGSVDDIRRSPAGIDVLGWAIDPDVLDPIEVHVYVDGQRTVLTADGTRNDVWYRLPFWGPQHGFSTTIPVGPGDHRGPRVRHQHRCGHGQPAAHLSHGGRQPVRRARRGHQPVGLHPRRARLGDRSRHARPLTCTSTSTAR